MCLRWTAAGTREGERRFRKIIGHADLAKLAIAVECELPARHAANHRHTPVATAAPEVVASPA